MATTLERVFNEEFTKIRSKPLKPSKYPKGKPVCETTTYFVFNNMENPILFLLFDIGISEMATTTTPLLQVSRSKSETAPYV